VGLNELNGDLQVTPTEHNRVSFRSAATPGYQLFDIRQEMITARSLFLAGVFEFGEGLLHGA
jgi:hypothetical protein